MSVNKKGGFLNLQTRSVTLNQGSYAAELKLKSDKSLTLELKMSDKGDILVPIKSDSSLKVPDNGAVKISGSSISQPFDLNGTIATAWTNSPQESGYESCSYTRSEVQWERVCRDAGDRNHRDVRCENERRDVEITTTGTRFVVSHFVTTNRKLDVALNDVKSNAQLATLSVSGTELARIVDNYGICR